MKIALVHTPKKLVPYLIRKVTNTYYNHCAVIVRINHKLFIVESASSGIVLVPFENWAQDKTITIFEIPNNLKNFNRLVSRIGITKYGYLDLLFFMIIKLITGIFYGKKVDSPDNNATCYEFVAWYLKMDNWYEMTPNLFIENIKNYTEEYHKILAKEYNTNLIK